MKAETGFTDEFEKIARDGRKYQRERGLRERLYDFLIKVLWWLSYSADATMTCETLGEIYCNVPDSIKDVYLRVDKFYKIDHDEPKRKEILEWLEK